MPSVTDLVFSLWYDKGIRTVKDLYSNNAVLSFAELSSKFQFPTLIYFSIIHFFSDQRLCEKGVSTFS